MSNDDQKTEISEVESEAIIENDVAEEPEQTSKPSGGSALGGIIAALIALGLAAFGGYYWHQNYYRHQTP